MRIVPETKVAPYEVESGNVLFLSRGQNPWAAAIGELPLTCIVPSSFYILRLARDRIDFRAVNVAVLLRNHAR